MWGVYSLLWDTVCGKGKDNNDPETVLYVNLQP